MFSVQDQIGLATPRYAPGPGVEASTTRMAVSDTDTAPWYSPANPLMWLGAVLLVTVGAAGVAGSVRVGRARVSAEVGRT